MHNPSVLRKRFDHKIFKCFVEENIKPRNYAGVLNEIITPVLFVVHATGDMNGLHSQHEKQLQTQRKIIKNSHWK